MSTIGPTLHEAPPAAATPRRLLLISYTFPPVGGAGVQRVTKFTKYLPQHGWQPTVLTVENPSVPALDQSLLADLPPTTNILRARTLEPGYAAKSRLAANTASPLRWARTLACRGVQTLLQPDAQVLWLPAARRAGRRLLRTTPHDAILVSAPPYSSFFLGATLAREFHLPLLLDYRDEWTIATAYLENHRHTGLARWLQNRMQARLVRRATALLATTRHSARALEKVCAAAGSDARVQCIYNGYDPDDFAAPAPPPTGTRFRLAYVGTLWNLTSLEPLARALELLRTNHPNLADSLELVVVGRRTPEQQVILDRIAALPCAVLAQPYLPHTQALELVRSADALCALLSDVPGAERVVPAKLFEYMAAGRSILGIAPRGEMWDLLAHYPAAQLHVPADAAGIAQSLAGLLAAFAKHGRVPHVACDVAQFSRPAQTAQLAHLLSTLVGEAR